ncbi:MAG: hypothetical protein EHM21_15355 [Chloroflexi bacterium]|nr:MAG: hypothetical protein EHM21_15355 [Chloroflexota bacterium]
MLVRTDQLLLKDHLAPITSSLGFIEGETSRTVEVFIGWQKEVQKKGSLAQFLLSNARSHNISGNLEQIFRSLLPLQKIGASRFLFIPTRTGWTAFVDNGYRGTDPAAIAHLANLLKSRSVWIVSIPHPLQNAGVPRKGRQGALIFEVYGHTRTHWLNLIRSIRLENDAGEWQFEQSGEPLPFEQARRYFDFDLMKRYLQELGLTPFEENFYLPDSNGAILVEINKPWKAENVSLEEARRLNGIDDSPVSPRGKEASS